MKKRRYTVDNFEQLWYSDPRCNEFILLDFSEVLNKKSRFYIQHKSCGFKYHTTCKSFFIMQFGCVWCTGKIPRYNQKEFLTLWENFKRKDEYDLIDYSDVSSDKSFITVFHKSCKKSFVVNCKHFFNNKSNGCFECKRLREKPAKINFLDKWNTSLKSQDYDLLDYSMVVDSKSYFIVRHRKCNFEYSVNYKNFFSSSCGCPKCNEPFGERAITDILSYKNINFERQVRFPSCRDKNVLSFDFFIPSLNVLIERQGVQHYQFFPPKNKRSFHENWEQFESQIRRDKIKREWAKANGYRLLVIPFWYKTYEDIEWFLSENL